MLKKSQYAAWSLNAPFDGHYCLTMDSTKGYRGATDSDKGKEDFRKVNNLCEFI